MLHILYTQIARARRRLYERRPHLRRRLTAPVISIGNLTVGGSGKTPLAAEIARMLIDMGERPSILSRGYAREVVDDGAVIVSDGKQVLADVVHAGDEPLMLARMVPRAAVVVASSRYVAGRLAESTLGCTVHVLDDGFQHFDLARDVEVLVAPDTLDDTRTLPFGRFREPLDAAAAADALLVEIPWDKAEALCHRVATAAPAPQTASVQPTPVGTQQIPVAQDFSPVIARLNVSTAFAFSRRIAGPAPDRPAYAFAGIARPARFFDALEKAGWRLTGCRAFGNHHRYSAREVEEIVTAAGASGAQAILTTEKDFVRVGPDPRIVPVPLEIAIAPAFKPWLAERLRVARARGGTA